MTLTQEMVAIMIEVGQSDYLLSANVCEDFACVFLLCT